MRHYDVLCVGAGLFSAVVAEQALQRGKSVLVLEKRDHIAGNIYTEKVQGIDVHRYGAHIFHTSNKNIWDYAGQFAEFNHFINEPIANYHGEIYNLPFNMNTFARRTWRNRPLSLSAGRSTRSSSRATRRNSGAGAARTCRRSLSGVFQCA